MSTLAQKQMNGFKQQDLKTWQPVLTPVAVIALLLAVAIIFMPIGIVLRDASSNVVQKSIRYDNIADCEVSYSDTYENLPKVCDVSFTLEKDMNAPIYFYYELHNYYQNYRRYVKSLSSDQLRGVDVSSTSDCSPVTTFNGSTLVACGLIAATFFEDRFAMSVNSTDLCNRTARCYNYGTNSTDEWHDHWQDWYEEPNWAKKGIAWHSDKEYKYINATYDVDNESGLTQVGDRQNKSGLRLPDINDEDFIVWMHTAALPNFKKLHRIIRNMDLKKGDRINITILNWFEVASFGGEKYIVLSTTEWCGGRNYVLAWIYIIVACIAIGLAVCFAFLLLFGTRSVKSYIDFKNGNVRWSM